MSEILKEFYSNDDELFNMRKHFFYRYYDYKNEHALKTDECMIQVYSNEYSRIKVTEGEGRIKELFNEKKASLESILATLKRVTNLYEIPEGYSMKLNDLIAITSHLKGSEGYDKAREMINESLKLNDDLINKTVDLNKWRKNDYPGYYVISGLCLGTVIGLSLLMHNTPKEYSITLNALSMIMGFMGVINVYLGYTANKDYMKITSHA